MDPTLTKEQQKLVQDLLRFWDFKRQEDVWALQKFDELTQYDPFLRWRMILALCREAPSRRVLLQIGGGPLEDLMAKNGQAFIANLKDEVKTNVRLLYALSGASIIGPESRELQKLWDKYNLWRSDRLFF